MADYCYLGNNIGIARLRSGHKIYVDTCDGGIVPHLAMDGIWETAVDAAIASVCVPGSIVVDVGANFGYHTLMMASRVQHGQVIAIEGNGHLCSLLARSIELNGFNDRVRLINGVAWSGPEAKWLNANPAYVGGGFVSEQRVLDRDYHGYYWDAAIKLDDLAEHVDLIRIDAEGSEMHILEGAKRLICENKHINIIMEWAVEMLQRIGGDVGPTISWLCREGFKFYTIDAMRHVQVDELFKLPHCDIHVCR